MNKLLLLGLIVFIPFQLLSQGMNNTWLLGNDPGWINFGRIVFDSSSYQLTTETRKMSFKGTQATISDNQGNFLMSSNGVWIANANNDTMLNGAGLNPGYYVQNWPDGLVITNGNIIVPYPGDTTKFVLFHQTRNSPNHPSELLYYSIIDKTLDNNLGGVISKNDTVLQDTINWGLTACRHANGRDWWVVVMHDSSDIVHKILFTSNGIESVTSQSLGYLPFPWSHVVQLTFSPDGSKLISTTYNPNVNDLKNYLLIFDFDRCSGFFFNTQIIQLTDSAYLWGLAFSPSGNIIYSCSSEYLFQINTNTLSVDTVATYDGFMSGFPPNCCATTFWNMYLAANGKIYITSGSGVQHIHEMNYPDSAGVACDVQQHTITLGNYFHLRAVPNHPNYYLGALTGSPCDTLTSVHEMAEHDFKFSVSPNPNNGSFRIMYLLPQNKKGKLEVFDVNGRWVYEMNLPQWSTLQYILLPESVADGIYNCVISSNGWRVIKKLVVIRE